MSRPVLSLARTPAKPKVSYARLRQAVRLWRKGYGSRDQRKGNARRWLKAVDMLGTKWVYAIPVTKREVKS